MLTEDRFEILQDRLADLNGRLNAFFSSRIDFLRKLSHLLASAIQGFSQLVWETACGLGRVLVAFSELVLYLLPGVLMILIAILRESSWRIVPFVGGVAFLAVPLVFVVALRKSKSSKSDTSSAPLKPNQMVKTSIVGLNLALVLALTVVISIDRGALQSQEVVRGVSAQGLEKTERDKLVSIPSTALVDTGIRVGMADRPSPGLVDTSKG
jgi:hypothetical protein